MEARGMADLRASIDRFGSVDVGWPLGAMLSRELAAAPVVRGGLIGIAPRILRCCLDFSVGNFVPEGGFFVLLDGDLLIIHEKVLSTVNVVGW